MLYSKIALSFACCIALITLAGEVSDRDLKIWARNGNASAAYNLAVRALNSGNQESAVTWMHKAAKLGSNEASYQLGNFYVAGKIVTVNQETALFWYLDSAQKGNMKAHEKIFAAYLKGAGTSPNWGQADYWLSKIINNSRNLKQLTALFRILLTENRASEPSGLALENKIRELGGDSELALIKEEFAPAPITNNEQAIAIELNIVAPAVKSKIKSERLIIETGNNEKMVSEISKLEPLLKAESIEAFQKNPAGPSRETAKELQRLMKNFGFYRAKVDGAWGSETENALNLMVESLKISGPDTYSDIDLKLFLSKNFHISSSDSCTKSSLDAKTKNRVCFQFDL